MSNKKQYQIKKVRRVLRLKSNDFQSATYDVWKVSGPRKLVKYFTLKKDATAWVKNETTRYALTTDQIIDVMRGK